MEGKGAGKTAEESPLRENVGKKKGARRLPFLNL